MKKLYYFLLVAVITIGAGFFASQSPDGLDFVSEKLGFAQKGMENFSIMTGYAIPFLGENHISTVMAGLIGSLIILIIFTGLKNIYIRMVQHND